jgi:hypothetical protein
LMHQKNTKAHCLWTQNSTMMSRKWPRNTYRLCTWSSTTSSRLHTVD